MSTETTPKTTRFCYETVDIDEKAERIRGMFGSVASRYDIMNGLMSLGIHRKAADAPTGSAPIMMTSCCAT